MEPKALRELADYIETNRLEKASVYISGQQKLQVELMAYVGDDADLVRRVKRLGRVKVRKSDGGATLASDVIAVSETVHVKFKLVGFFSCEKVGEKEVPISEEAAASEAAYLTERITEMAAQLQDARRGIVRKPIIRCQRVGESN